MTSHSSRASTRSWQRRALSSVFLLALACNALTGVDDLDFSDTSMGALTPENMGNAAAADGAARAGNMGGLAGMGGSAGSSPCTLPTDDGCGGSPAVAPPPTNSASRNCDLVTTGEPRLGLQECGEGLRCTFVPDPPSAGHADCTTSLMGAVAAPCNADADCLPTLNCFRNRCAVACDASASTCAERQQCGGLSILAGQEVGSCCSVPAGQECSMVTDCGCGPGETCSIVDETGQTRCRVVPPSAVTPYAGCTAHEQCPARHSCLSGACKLHCESVGDCGAEGVFCAPANRDGNPIPGFSFCSRGCDLLSPQEPGVGLRACGSQSTCAFFSSTMDRTDCIEEGPGVQGSACTADRDCSAGLDCFFQTCERWCEPSSSASCGEGLTCSQVFSYAGRELGHCCQVPAGETCDWVTSCGCGARESCERDANGARFCRAVSPAAVAPFAACSLPEECPAGYTCAGGTCLERCLGSADCGQAGAVCIPISSADVEGACSRTCDALAPQAPAVGFEPCAPSLTCVIAGTGASVCTPPGTVAAGGDCSASVFDCATGLRCNQDVCRRFCDLSADDCPNGTTCTQANPAVPTVGGRSLGLCLPD